MDNKDLVLLLAKRGTNGSGAPLVVTLTESGGVYSADKTLAEILAAYAGGTSVELHCGAVVAPLTRTNGTSAATFVDNSMNLLTGKLDVTSYLVQTGETWTVSTYHFEQAPATVEDLVSTSVTLANAADNTVYSYGELTDLTVTAIANPGAFIISFVSGATPTVLTLPAVLDDRMPADFAVEADTYYEINVRNGHPFVGTNPEASA